MSLPFLPVNVPDLKGNEKKYLNECIDTEWISSAGPFVKKFEENFAKRVNRKHAIAITNGSAALEIAVRALGIGEGDEVIIPSFCIISCSQAVVYNKAKPVLVDSEFDTTNLDVTKLEAAVTKNTKAIMVVHTYGFPVDMDPVIEIAKKHNLEIIEDAAEMHGQTYKGKPCGSFGAVSTFSFYPNKHITTGEGGMVLCDDDKIAERLRSYRNLCFSKERFIHNELGWNLRMTNLQAALGVAQLERLDKFVEHKRKLGVRYTEKLAPLKDKLFLPVTKKSYADNIYWVYPVVLKDCIKKDAREVLGEIIKKYRIGCRPFFYPTNKQPVFIKMGLFTGKETDFPISEKLATRGFYIPMGTGLTFEQQDRVVKAMLDYFQ